MGLKMLYFSNLKACTGRMQNNVIVTFSVCVFSSSTGGGGGGSGNGSEKIASLEQKLFKLQEELTELHRQKGEVSYFVIL